MPKERGISLAHVPLWIVVVLWCCVVAGAQDGTEPAKGAQSRTEPIKPIGSHTHLKVADAAPDFLLKDLSGTEVKLSQFRGTSNVVISFIPAAWTPVCSHQWPGYNVAKEIFQKHNTVVLGISVDNAPTLQTWTQQMGDLWFPVLSDFWPHGAVAKEYGILRSDGMAERALFVIDKQGIIRYVDVHEISSLPRLEALVKELDKLPK
jgi:peroxiredoxin